MTHSTYIHEDDGENIYISVSGSLTALVSDSDDDDGTSGVREPLTPRDNPPSLAVTRELDGT